jgi:enolase
MAEIISITFRKVLNSHVEFTYEWIIELDNGSVGIGGSPQGETISIYEDRDFKFDPELVCRMIADDGYTGRAINQEIFDDYLQKQVSRFGRNTAYGLSLAFHNACGEPRVHEEFVGRDEDKDYFPQICFNIINGGWHAYTNPVLSDFHEYILVSKNDSLEEAIACHNEIQRSVREALLNQDKTTVAGNVVNRFSTIDNRECIDFLLNIRDRLGYTEKFDLMIDSSCGDLWEEDKYRFSVTDNSTYSPGQLTNYWLEIIEEYGLGFLEDPFHEKDMQSWAALTNSQDACMVIGDNFYSSDSQRIQEGANKKYTHGVIIKPNQAGTVTAVQQAIDTARKSGQIIITSHRSISTESTFLSKLTCENRAKYIKIGPLMTDYSAVVRLNEIIRLTEGSTCQ